VFRRELSDKDWLKRHFEREVSALEQVRHPKVVQIYSHGLTAAGAPYLAMEFIEGQTLRELLNKGALPARYSATLLRHGRGARSDPRLRHLPSRSEARESDDSLGGSCRGQLGGDRFFHCDCEKTG
jgi:serine/threonine protein kinase